MKLAGVAGTVELTKAARKVTEPCNDLPTCSFCASLDMSVTTLPVLSACGGHVWGGRRGNNEWDR